MDGTTIRAEPFDEATDLNVCGIVRDAFSDHVSAIKVAIVRLYLSDASGGYRLLRLRMHDTETDEIIIPKDAQTARAMKVLEESGIGFDLVEIIGSGGEPIICWADDLRPFVPVLKQTLESPVVTPRELTPRERALKERLDRAGQN